MQANTLVINDGTTSRTVNRFLERANNTIYTVPGASPLRFLVGLYRAFPKRTGSTYGVQRNEAKVTYDTMVMGPDGVEKASPTIIKIGVDRPQGSTVSVAQVKAILTSLVDDTDLLTKLVDNNEI